MSRIEWNCCGSITETEHKPEACPFCNEVEKGSKVSREHYEARVLREYAEKFFGNSHITSDIKAKRKMLKEADRIEKEANDE